MESRLTTAQEPCVQTEIVAVAYWKGTNKRKGEERVQEQKKKEKET